MKLAFTRFGKLSANTAILFVHGHTSSKETWNIIHDRFLEFDCLSIDLRGHGNSPLSEDDDYSPEACVSDIHELVNDEIFSDKGEKKKVFIIGHSMGGRIVVPYAVTHSEYVNGVIIEDMDMIQRSYPIPEKTEDEIKELKSFSRQFSNLEDCEKELLHFGYPKDYIDRWKTTDRIQKNDNGYWCAIHPWVSRNCLIQILTKDSTDTFTKLSNNTIIPTLLLIAEHGSATSTNGIEEMKNIMPRMQVEFIKESGHSIHRTNTDEFTELVTSFINKH